MLNNGYAWFILGYQWLYKVIQGYLLFIHGYQWLSANFRGLGSFFLIYAL